MNEDSAPLLFSQMEREWAIAHSTHVLAAEHIKHLEARIALLRGTITGFATNGTNCKACQQSNDCARERLAADDLLART